MTANPKERERPGDDPQHHFASIYDEHVGLLVGTAIENFGIGESDAQTLAHEVFLAYFLKADDVRDVRAWLVGGISNACRHYLRTRSREAELPTDAVEKPDPQSKDVRDSLPAELAGRQALACLTARCQLALHLHYVEGFTIPEIAAQLRTTPAYAHKLVTRCMKQARKRYGGKEGM